MAADPGVPLRDDLSVCAHRALPGLRNLERYATHGGHQVAAPATGEMQGKANKLVKQVSKLFRIKLFELC